MRENIIEIKTTDKNRNNKFKKIQNNMTTDDLIKEFEDYDYEKYEERKNKRSWL